MRRPGSTVPRSPQLLALLGEVVKAVPAPSGERDWQASLQRNRQIQQILMSKAIDAAEEKYPGFLDMIGELIEAEVSFMNRAGPQC